MDNTPHDTIDEMDFEALHQYAMSDRRNDSIHAHSYAHPATIIEVRRCLNLTRKAFGKQIGATANTIAQAEAGDKTITPEQAYAVEVLFLDYFEHS